jgi:hypothetical protein
VSHQSLLIISIQAFEMCHVGEYNLSYASLTSATTLTALRLLPKTNPTLYDEICTDKIDISSGGEEPAFPVDDDQCDGSDIPIDVICLTVMSGGSVVDDGFAVDDAGGVVRTGVAEDIEQVEEGNDLDKLEDEVAREELGRGRRVKQGSKRYGIDWEEH